MQGIKRRRLAELQLEAGNPDRVDVTDVAEAIAGREATPAVVRTIAERYQRSLQPMDQRARVVPGAAAGVGAGKYWRNVAESADDL